MSAVTGISGIQLSAASAAYAPTNSADVSAIASAYQVVSATATQLNAGTAYVTSINETPISAARAGNAANASLANSAWYDGTGRMISALPDEATVSSIASAYAESAASSKLDESATADFYSTSNPSGFITGVDLSNYATTAYVDSSISSFVDSAYVESQVSSKEDKLTFGYDDSAISSINGSALAGGGGAQVVTSLQYVTSESATIVETTTADTDVGYGTKDISAAYVDSDPWTDYSSSSPLLQVRMTAGGPMRDHSGYPFYLYMVPYGATNYGNVSNTGEVTGALSYGNFSGGMDDFILATGSASSIDPYLIGITFNVTRVPFIGSQPAFWGTEPGGYPVDSDNSSRPVFCVAGDYDGIRFQDLRGYVTAEMDFGSVVTVSSVSGINQLGIVGGGADMSAVSAIASSYANGVSAAASSTVSVVSSNSSTWARDFSVNNVTYIDSIITGLKTGTGYYDSASAIMGVGSALQTTTGSGEGSDPGVDYPMGLYLHNGTVQLSTTDYYHQVYVRFMRGDGSFSVEGLYPTAYITDVSGDISAYSTDGSFTLNYTANNVEPLAFQNDLPTFQYDAEDKISSINGSAIAGGAGGVDSATCSAIASAYAESAVSSKLDESATADFYSTSNPSGFIDSAYVDSAVSGKADSSALSSYVPYSSLEYNSASAISGINGSALAAGSTYSAGEGIDITDDVISVEAPVDIVAGPGIVIDNPDGNTLRVSVAQDVEVTLYENSTGAQSVTLSESAANFERIAVWVLREGYTAYTEILNGTNGIVFNNYGHGNTWIGLSCAEINVNGTSVSIGSTDGFQISFTISSGTPAFRYASKAAYGAITKVVGIHRIASN